MGQAATNKAFHRSERGAKHQGQLHSCALEVSCEVRTRASGQGAPERTPPMRASGRCPKKNASRGPPATPCLAFGGRPSCQAKPSCRLRCNICVSTSTTACKKETAVMAPAPARRCCGCSAETRSTAAGSCEQQQRCHWAGKRARQKAELLAYWLESEAGRAF